MKLANKKLLEQLEANVLYPYDDRYGASRRLAAWNKWATIGIGYLIPENEWQKYRGGITKEQSYSLLDITLDDYELAVRKAIKIPLNNNQYDALSILCYNIGIDGFSKSQVVKAINGQPIKYSNLEAAWMAWNKDEGKVSPGLTKRRQTEYKLYNTKDESQYE